jgi:hypothetical protein
LIEEIRSEGSRARSQSTVQQDRGLRQAILSGAQGGFEAEHLNLREESRVAESAGLPEIERSNERLLGPRQVATHAPGVAKMRPGVALNPPAPGLLSGQAVGDQHG